MPFNGDTLKTSSLGGSETAGLCLARELARRGHYVYMFCNGEPGTYDGVEYLPLDMWPSFVQSTPHDVAIVQRVPQHFAQATAAKLNILWCHDLALREQYDQFNGVLWNVDKVCLLSDYHVDNYKDVYNLKDAQIFRTRNGIDLDLFPEGEERDRKTIMYCARPERGLDRLLEDIFPKILAAEPDATLKLATYDNPADHFRDFYAHCNRLVEQFGDRVQFLGHLTKPELYQHYARAGVYAYPTPSALMGNFREISCITAMECQAAGVPFVSTENGALPETLAEGAGTLIEEGDTYAEEFVAEVLRYMRDDEAFESASRAGKEAAQDMQWSQVAEEWEQEFLSLIAERNDDKVRLALHFIRHSDIMAARHALEGVDSPVAEYVNNYPVTDYGAKEITPPNFRASTNDARFRAVAQWIAHLKPETLLDAACGTGAFSVGISKLGVKVTGLDISRQSIDYAEHLAAEQGEDVRFVNGDLWESNLPPHDAVLAAEVLEHVEEPWRLLEKVESLCKLGGNVLVTVPYGPWELGTDNREHLWEFDAHDIKEMVGHKPGFSLYNAACGYSKVSGEAIGHYYLRYEADHSGVKPIDMERKLFLQRPRQTVTVSMIGGPNVEETILWNLRSIRPYVDRIVIGDTGLSDIAKAMLQDHGATIVPAPNPLESGFAAARNATLSSIDTDWIMWIDTDEKLLQGVNLHKYLRENCFNGYGIRQHHFAIDTQFAADMPVRIFRNRPYEGKDMEWIGCIHEHPELGMNEGPGPIIVVSDLNIAHLGYLVETTRKERFWRNYPLLQMDIKENPDRVLQKHFIMRDNMLLVGYELQENGGYVTDTIRQRCQENVDLWREYFKGKPGYVNVDSLQYYSQALEVLGQGFTVKFDIKAGSDDSPTYPEPVRFANEDDYLSELTCRAKAISSQHAEVH